MDALSMAAASGMKAKIESLEMLANNIANQGSPGYKADREFYSLYIAPEALEAADASLVQLPTTAPVIERHWTDFTQGTLTETGNPLHLAMSGRGFFTVAGPQGPLYTRAGAFRLSAAGRLETQERFAVLSADGAPIDLNPTQSVEVSQAGEIRQNGNVVAQMGLVDFEQPERLSKHAGTYFQMSVPDAARRQTSGEVLQGRLEASNQAPAEAAVRLVTVMRQFEMLQRALVISGEMNRRVDDVARVGN